MRTGHRKAAYLSYVAIEAFGAMLLVWRILPAYRTLSTEPGMQIVGGSYDDPSTYGVLLVLQVLYWYRVLRHPIPFQGSSVVLRHALLFLGRLSFVFASAVFSIVFLRHLPALDPGVNVSLVVLRSFLLALWLFTLFCVSLELESLGRALGPGERG